MLTSSKYLYTLSPGPGSPSLSTLGKLANWRLRMLEQANRMITRGDRKNFFEGLWYIYKSKCKDKYDLETYGFYTLLALHKLGLEHGKKDISVFVDGEANLLRARLEFDGELVNNHDCARAITSAVAKCCLKVVPLCSYRDESMRQRLRQIAPKHLETSNPLLYILHGDNAFLALCAFRNQPWLSQFYPRFILHGGAVLTFRYVWARIMAYFYRTKMMPWRVENFVFPSRIMRCQFQDIYRIHYRPPQSTRMEEERKRILQMKIDRVPKPPCIEMLVRQAKRHGHIGYKGRSTLALWMANVGIERQQAESFMRTCLSGEESSALDLKGFYRPDKQYSCRSCRTITMMGLSDNHSHFAHGCPMKGDTKACARDIEDLLKAKSPNSPVLKNPAQWTQLTIQRRKDFL